MRTDVDKKRWYPVLLVVAVIFLFAPLEQGGTQVIPCDVTCTPPPPQPGCETHVDWVCSNCGTAPICQIFPSLCTSPNPGREGTRIEHTVCTSGSNTEVWSDAPCGYCAG